MKCKCGGDFDAVKDSRPTTEGPAGPSIRRRRTCNKCDERITTYEVPAGFFEGFKAEVAKEMAMKLIKDFL